MTRVDFYILQDVDLSAAWRFACRLSAKAVGGGHRVHIHADPAAVAEVDELLWHFPQDRFLPHARADERPATSTAAPIAPLIIGSTPPDEADGVLINLADHIPTFFGRFERVAEIVVGANRGEGRDRYKFYRDRGYPLFHHELDDWEAA
ncbi:MAG: DNA polymerase III subunit chi [Pseudomonadales bacterium]